MSDTVLAAMKGLLDSLHAAVKSLQVDVARLLDTVHKQDARIAELEALEGYGWRAPEVYVPTAIPSVTALSSTVYGVRSTRTPA